MVVRKGPGAWRTSRYLFNLLRFAALAAAVGFGLVYPNLQAYLTLHPTRYLADFTPADMGLAYEEISFPGDGITIRGWFVPGTRGKALILVHGTPGERSAMLPYGLALHREGYSLLLFDLRAHGQSGGDITTLGYREPKDMLGAVAFLKEQRRVNSIGALGTSLGAVVVLQAAALSADIKAVVADGAFATLQEVINEQRRRGPWLLFLAMPLVQMFGEWQGGFRAGQVRPIDAVGQIAPRPALFIHGLRDDFIPYPHSIRLYEAAGEPKQLWLVPQAYHSGARAVDPAEYDRRVRAFFEKALGPSP